MPDLQTGSPPFRSPPKTRGLPAACLLLLALGLWLHWVADGVFKADDFEALRYVSDPARVLHDFYGAQYDLIFFRFWRPFITLSLAVDRLLFGLEATGFLWMNVLAFLASALLLLGLCVRLVPGRRGLCFGWVLAALWLLHPTVLVSLRWVVGRVDTHTVLWILIALHLHLRRRRGGASWPVWLAFAVALGHKESALGLPFLALGIDVLDPRPDARGRRFPGLFLLVVIPPVLLARVWMFGEVTGGYGFLSRTRGDPLEMLEGFWNHLGMALVPRFPLENGPGGTPPWLEGLRLLLPFLLPAGILHVFRKDPVRGLRLFSGLFLLAGGLYGPLLPLLPSMRDPGNQRYAYFVLLFPLGLLLFTFLVLLGAGEPEREDRPAEAGPSPRRGAGFPGFGLRPGEIPVLALPFVLAFLLHPSWREEDRILDGHDAFVRSGLEAMEAAGSRLDDAAAQGRRDPALELPILLGGEVERTCHPQRFLWGLGAVRRPPFVPAARARDVVSLRALLPNGRPIPETWFAGLPGYLEVTAGGFRVPEVTKEAPLEASRLFFEGVLRAEDLAPSSSIGKPASFALGEGFGGKVVVATPLGAMLLVLPAGKDRLVLRDLLLASPTDAKGAGLFAGLLLWNTFDLEKDSGVHLFWKEGKRLVHAAFRPAPDLSKRLYPALLGNRG